MKINGNIFLDNFLIFSFSKFNLRSFSSYVKNNIAKSATTFIALSNLVESLSVNDSISF